MSIQPDSRAPQTFRARWTAWRNRWLASPRFQRRVAALPPARPVARARSRRLFDLVAGFVYAQVLHAFVVGGWLERLAQGPCREEELAAAAGLPPEAARRLVRAAASLRLAEALGQGWWTLGSEGAALAGAGGIAEMVAHHRLLYADLADPLELLRAGRGGLARYWNYSDAGAAAARYSALMAASQSMVADQLLGAYRIARHRRLLDVGGGEGAFLARAGAAAPRLALGLLELPAVVERAQARLEAAGLGARVRFHAGSFLDGVPEGYDLVTLVRVLHDHDDAPALRLLTAVRRALPPGGRLLIAEPMAATPGAEPMGDAYFGMYLWAMGQGRPRTPREIAAMLREAGFSRSRLLSTALPIVARVIVARA